MKEKNISQEHRLKNVYKTTNYFLEEIKHNELMSRKHKTVCATLNYIKHFLNLASQLLDVFQFLFYFFAWYSCRNYKFCNRIKSLCNSCRN